ncbi:class D sortase [Bacillus zhangzhouensis]|uniref:class D sortase n=1 Tax=Bacillus zhangzhouensis TaxID=1178540 RepID=UPI0028132E63|nr:class D sortase [Bacillus zhangzhouensis]MDR0126149.1 class D sortase [Bacillus zhangzhouensis]
MLISVPLIYEWRTSQEAAAMERALKMIKENDSDNLSSIPHLTVSEEDLRDVMELEIPSIDLNEKVLPVTSEENLDIALTQIKPHQLPGEGNFTIAGHRGYRGDRLFRQLPEVPKGEKVILHHQGETYEYQIVSSATIEPTDVDVLKDREKNELTLITCTLDGKKRFVLKGIRTNDQKGERISDA